VRVHIDHRDNPELFERPGRNWLTSGLGTIARITPPLYMQSILVPNSAQNISKSSTVKVAIKAHLGNLVAQ
jgi:hypothetical protein